VSNQVRAVQRQRFRRFRQSALQVKAPGAQLRLLVQVALLVGIATLQVRFQYLLNAWNREFFDSLERHEVRELWHHTADFLPLAAGSVVLAVLAMGVRRRAQRRWRALLTENILGRWLADDHFRKLDAKEHDYANPEYRIGEDVRVATEAPVELGVALFTSVLTAGTFFSVLWQIGGALEIAIGGSVVRIPGYLVLGVMSYAALFTFCMVMMGERLTGVIEDKNQAEAEFRAGMTLLRECGEAKAPPELEPVARERIAGTQPRVFQAWREVAREVMRTTWVSHANFLLTPVVGWFLCAPKYLKGAMTLGELTQTAAAFVTVLGAFNWLVDNFQRFADWRSSVDRVAALLLALDQLDRTDET